jgi:hypothetical protein
LALGRLGIQVPGQLPRQEDVEQVVLEIDVAGQAVVPLAQEEPVRDRKKALLVLRSGQVERFTREERRLGHAPVTGFEHQFAVGNPRQRRLYVRRTQSGARDAIFHFQRHSRGRELAVTAEEHVANRRRTISRGV